MATASETLQPDYSKEEKNFENIKCQIDSVESESQEIKPSAPCDITNINIEAVVTAAVNEAKSAVAKLDQVKASSEENAADSENTDKTAKAERVRCHPLQGNNADDDTITNDKNDSDTATDSERAQRSNKKKRHVFFPEDGHIVSGYMEPPSPWNDVSQCSTEELIDAYKKACERFGVKPLPRVLQQLNVINDFGDRNETLTLRGERLDSKHCETIEEILRRVQFRTFDLENAHLDDEGTVALFDMIEHYESCNRLNISNNRTIGIRGWQACARLMKKTPCLETLEARNCVISEQVMPFFCRSLKIGSSLTVLHLENSIMSGRHLFILTQALKMNDTLQELYLADNKLMPSDGKQLGNLLQYNFTLQLLDVRNNHLQDVGVSHICDGLWEQNLGQGLATIVLWNNQVTYQAMNSLSRALTNTRSLETLNLGHNNITNEGIHRLKEGLLRNKSLLRIGLQASKISCEGAVALAEFIAESPRLRRIDLRENDIKTGGLMALSLALKVSRSVTRIDLDKETKRETSMKDYAEQQQRLMNDINNYMQRNRELIRLQEEQSAKQKQEQQEKEDPEADKGKQENNQQMNRDNQVSMLDDANQKGEQTEMANQDKNLDATREENVIRLQQQHHHPRPDNLDLNSGRGPHTLDSPAFLSEAALAAFSDSLQLDSQMDAEEKAKSGNVQTFFPPSPMVSDNGRPTLAPILGAAPSVISPETQDSIPTSMASLDVKPLSSMPTEVLRKSPCSSPTTKRKFIISRVQEPNRPEPTPLSTESQPVVSLTDVVPPAGIVPADITSNVSTSSKALVDTMSSASGSSEKHETTGETKPASHEVSALGQDLIDSGSVEVGIDVADPAPDQVSGSGTDVVNLDPIVLSGSGIVSGISELDQSTDSSGTVMASAASAVPLCPQEPVAGHASNEVSGFGSEAASPASVNTDRLNISPADLSASSCSSAEQTTNQMTDSCRTQRSTEHSDHASGQPQVGSDPAHNSTDASILHGLDPTITQDTDNALSQRLNECTKTVSELGSMNGVSQNIVAIQPTPEQSTDQREADRFHIQTSKSVDSSESEIQATLPDTPEPTAC